MARETKSPIKDLPVRQPGESTRERIIDVALDKFLIPFLAAGFLLVLAIVEWCKYFSKSPPTPVLYTVIAGMACIAAAVRSRSAFKEIQNLRLGRVGEEAVGQYLEEKLRPLGCHVLHDIPGKGFNVDHVIVGPTGVFSVETKTCSKPARGASLVQYDGETVKVDGFVPDRDPIVQAKAQAHWIHELLESSTGRKIAVQPIVLYPGWYVERMPANADVWVLNDKALPTFVQNSKSTTLSSEDISLIVFHLKRYVIAENAKA